MKALALITVAIFAVFFLGLIAGEPYSAFEQRVVEHNCHKVDSSWICADGYNISP